MLDRHRHPRPGRAVAGAASSAPASGSVADDLVGHGRQHRHRRTPACCSPPRSRRAEPGQVSRSSSLADGADVLLFRTTDAIAAWHRPARSPTQVAAGDARCPTASSCRGAAWSPSSRRAGPSPTACRRRRRAAARTGSTASSARATARAAPCTCRRPGCRFDGGAVDDMEPLPMADVHGHDRHVHHRPPRLLAEPAGRVRGRRLRRRRPAPGRAHRRRRRRASRSATGSR